MVTGHVPLFFLPTLRRLLLEELIWAPWQDYRTKYDQPLQSIHFHTNNSCPCQNIIKHASQSSCGRGLQVFVLGRACNKQLLQAHGNFGGPRNLF